MFNLKCGSCDLGLIQRTIQSGIIVGIITDINQLISIVASDGSEIRVQSYFYPERDLNLGHETDDWWTGLLAGLVCPLFDKVYAW